MKSLRQFQLSLARIRRGVEPTDTSQASLARSRKAAARRVESTDAVRTVAHAAIIIARYREKGIHGKPLAARLVRHARLLSALDPEVALELIERANAIEWEAKQAC